MIADHAYGMRLGLDHLQSLGHRRIVATIHDESPPGRLLRTYFVDQLVRRGMPQLLPPMLTPPGRTAEALDPIVDAVITNGATAIVVHTDWTAQALVPRLRAAGRRVPEDVSVVAYDDIVTPEVDLALTSISPAKHELGIQAVSLLLRRHRVTRAGRTRRRSLTYDCCRCSSSAPRPVPPRTPAERFEPFRRLRVVIVPYRCCRVDRAGGHGRHGSPTRRNSMTSAAPISRRTLLGAASGIAASGLAATALAGCGSAGDQGPGTTSGPVALPAQVPFEGATPDLKGTAAGVPDAAPVIRPTRSPR